MIKLIAPEVELTPAWGDCEDGFYNYSSMSPAMGRRGGGGGGGEKLFNRYSLLRLQFYFIKILKAMVEAVKNLCENAISGSPIINGTNQFPNPPIMIGI